MARYKAKQAVDAAALLEELNRAGVPTHDVDGEGWATVADDVTVAAFDAVVAAHDASARARALAAQEAEATQDRSDYGALFQAIANDRAALVDTSQTFTVAQLRACLARTDAAVLLLGRAVRRLGGA